MATGKTCALLRSAGFETEWIAKIEEGLHPNVVDAMEAGQVQLIINTPSGRRGQIRREAVNCGIPYLTTMAAAAAAARGLLETGREPGEVCSLQQLHASIKEV